MPKAGNHLIMSVLDAMGCDRAEDIFNFGEGGDAAISGMILKNMFLYVFQNGRAWTKVEGPNLWLQDGFTRYSQTSRVVTYDSKDLK